ncbi:hypothetical protein K1719_028711 [Acacia pycnantha]|nr:hypothetical protein K1719_028711 [Acacia pycnantha]
MKPIGDQLRFRPFNCVVQLAVKKKLADSLLDDHCTKTCCLRAKKVGSSLYYNTGYKSVKVLMIQYH